MNTGPVESELCNRIRQDWEDPRYEVKRAMAWNEHDSGSIGVVKDVLALANSGGGSLVIGVAEENGRLEFRGLPPEQLATWDPTRFGATVNRFAAPPIQCTVRNVECDGNTFVLISVPGFWQSPHFCTRDYDGVLKQQTIYIRTANSASAPVNDAATMMALINQAVTARQDELARIVRAAIGGAEQRSVPHDSERFRAVARQTLDGLEEPFGGRYAGYITNVMYPARFQADQFTVEQLRRAIDESRTPQYPYGSFFFRRPGQPVFFNDGLGFEWALQGTQGDDFYTYWRLVESGLLVHKELMFEDSRHEAVNPTVLFIDYFVQRVFVALDALVRFYLALGLQDEEATWQIELAGSEGRTLSELNMMMREDYISREPVVTFSWTLSIENWRMGLEDHVIKAVQHVLRVFQFDADLSARIRTVIERYRRGQP
jgi:hypothetical protein